MAKNRLQNQPFQQGSSAQSQYPVWNQWASQWTGGQSPGGGQYAQYSIPTQIVPGPNGQPTALLQLQPGISVRQLVVATPNGQTQVFPLKGTGKGGGGNIGQGFPNQGFQNQGYTQQQTGQYAMLSGSQQTTIKHLLATAQSMGITKQQLVQALTSGKGGGSSQQGFRQQKQRRQTARSS